MNDIARKEKNEYYRRWREKNRDKVRESNRKYWERKAAEKEAKKNAEDENN